MSFHRLHTRALGHAATIVACDETHRAIVVDPGRDVAPLVALADEHELTIVHVLDTHGHNDYLSGLSALVAATGATPLVLAGGPATYDAREVEDGERISLGALELELLHTPGHTPEHVALVVRAPGATPVLISGGSLLVGDVGRPDLLGGDGDIAAAAHATAATILDRLLPLGDEVRVLPTHVAGSLCAGAIGEGLETTIGTERQTNPAILAMLAQREGGPAWLDRSTLPPVPRYWPRMRGANLEGVALDWVPDVPAQVDVPDTRAALDAGTLVLDVRTPDAFARGHLAGSYFAPVGDGVATWAGAALPDRTDLIVVAATRADAARATADLWRIGLGPVVGWLDAAALDADDSLASLDQSDISEAIEAADRGAVTLLDVRAPLEHRASPIPGAVALPATAVLRDLSLAPDGPLDVVCASGIRSTVVAAALARGQGGRLVTNVRGGMSGLG